MNRNTNFAISGLLALWLATGCATNAAEDERANTAHERDTQTTEFVTGSTDSTAVPVSNEGAFCDDDLVDILVNREVDELIEEGSTFQGFVEGSEELPYQDRLNAFKEKRSEELGTFFDCRNENAEFHRLASEIIENPGHDGNADKFRAILSTIGSERMDDIEGLYPRESVEQAMDVWKQRFVDYYSEAFENVDHFFKEEELDRRLDALLDQNYESWVMSAARIEMADFLGVEGVVDPGASEAYANGFVKAVKDIVEQYGRDLYQMKTANPSFDI